MKLSEFQQLVDGATPGPWELISTGPVKRQDGTIGLVDLQPLNIIAGFQGAVVAAPGPAPDPFALSTIHNAAFIAACRDMVPKLLEVTEAARQSLRRDMSPESLRLAQALAALEADA